MVFFGARTGVHRPLNRRTGTAAITGRAAANAPAAARSEAESGKTVSAHHIRVSQLSAGPAFTRLRQTLVRQKQAAHKCMRSQHPGPVYPPAKTIRPLQSQHLQLQNDETFLPLFLRNALTLENVSLLLTYSTIETFSAIWRKLSFLLSPPSRTPKIPNMNLTEI